MHAPCNCSQTMNLGFRAVIYGRKIEVKKVPIWECESCKHYEVFPLIKASLLELLDELKDELKDEDVVSVTFTDHNELASIMYEVSMENKHNEMDADAFTSEVTNRCKERINLLLDVYGYAKSSGDAEWMEILMKRLSQLAFTTAKAT